MLTNLHNEAHNIRLSTEEKARMRAHIFGMPTRVPSYTISRFHFFSIRFVPVMAAVLIVVLGGGTAYAAQGALPGDLLYPVKISVNERVELALATTPEAKAQAEAKLAERRVAEAEELDATGRLDADITTQLEQAFSEHAERAIALAEASSSTTTEAVNEDEDVESEDSKLSMSAPEETQTMKVEMSEHASTSMEMSVTMVATTSLDAEAEATSTATTTNNVSQDDERDDDSQDIRALLEKRKERFKELRARFEQYGSEVKGEFIERHDWHGNDEGDKNADEDDDKDNKSDRDENK